MNIARPIMLLMVMPAICPGVNPLLLEFPLGFDVEPGVVIVEEIVFEMPKVEDVIGAVFDFGIFVVAILR